MKMLLSDEMVLFYGVPHGCSFGSIVAMEWLRQPYRLCRIDMPVDAADDVYVRINAARETPALLLEDGEAINESLAILQHLIARDTQGRLGFRQGTREFDRLNHALALLHTTCHSAWGALFYAGDAAGSKGVEARAKAARAYARVETMLTGRDWLAGAAPTVADAYLHGTARWGQELGFFDIQREYPHLHAHRQRMLADPAVAFAHAIEDQRPAITDGAFRGHVTLQEIAARIGSPPRQRVA